MSFINKLFIKFYATQIGSDKFGNQYCIGKHKNYLGQAKRFVVYNGIDESTKVPPMWHSWLHYVSDDLPRNGLEHDWQQEYLPNLTATKYAHVSSGSVAQNLKTYLKWTPN